MTRTTKIGRNLLALLLGTVLFSQVAFAPRHHRMGRGSNGAEVVVCTCCLCCWVSGGCVSLATMGTLKSWVFPIVGIFGSFFGSGAGLWCVSKPEATPDPADPVPSVTLDIKAPAPQP